MGKIRIGIFGYGNLGKSVELGLREQDDMQLAGVFTRRDPSVIKLITDGVAVYPVEQSPAMTARIDVLLLCGGSMTDLPLFGPFFAGMFNTVDGFDNHAQIADYFAALDEKANQAGKVCIISSGWDPGLFSLNRLYADVILPRGKTYTFWGRGISQGHSEAIRRIAGVRDAIQYTIPVEEAIEAVKNGKRPELSPREKHRRQCFVVVEDGADKTRIAREIKSMPHYFSDYDTELHFISAAELKENHHGFPHGGLVIGQGQTGLKQEHSQTIEYKLNLQSNPEFTANILLAFARAAFRLQQEGVSGAKTVLDIAPAYLSPKSAMELRKTII